MQRLCDVNVLLALATDRHVHHPVALRWLDGITAGEAVVCRLAQTGLLRLLNNPAVMREEALDTVGCWEFWHRMLQDERIIFSPDEPAGLDAAFEQFTTGRAFTPRLWSDAYLAAYAHAGGMTMVTLDQGFHSFLGLACEVLESE